MQLTLPDFKQWALNILSSRLVQPLSKHIAEGLEQAYKQGLAQGRLEQHDAEHE